MLAPACNLRILFPAVVLSVWMLHWLDINCQWSECVLEVYQLKFVATTERRVEGHIQVLLIIFAKDDGVDDFKCPLWCSTQFLYFLLHFFTWLLLNSDCQQPLALLIQLFKYKLIFTRLVVIISGGRHRGKGDTTERKWWMGRGRRGVSGKDVCGEGGRFAGESYTLERGELTGKYRKNNRST